MANRRAFLKRMLLWGSASLSLLAGGTACRPRSPAAFPTLTPFPSATPESTPVTVTLRPWPAPPASGQAYLSAAHGADPAEITRRAVEALGGMGRFVRPGQTVVIKPNICLDRSPEYAVTTNPDVVATLVTLCREAGAAAVQVMDYGLSGRKQAAVYAVSGIGPAVEAAGGQMVPLTLSDLLNARIPEGQAISAWPVFPQALRPDVLIVVPVLKNHALTRLTLSAKNLMGLAGYCGDLHDRKLSTSIVDLVTLFRPALAVVDAYRVLRRWNIDTSSQLSDVEERQTVIASHDIVAADAYAANLVGVAPDTIDYIRLGAERGLGSLDLKSLKIEETH